MTLLGLAFYPTTLSQCTKVFYDNGTLQASGCRCAFACVCMCPTIWSCTKFNVHWINLGVSVPKSHLFLY